MSIDRYLDRVYDGKSYNCLHLTVDVWRDLTGQDLSAHLAGLLHGLLGARALGTRHARAFRALGAPLDPCLVLFQAPRTVPHVGVWVRGRVLHIRSRVGVQYVTLQTARVGFTKVRFIQPC